ncbi:MAG TPA: response regulator [Acidobacteriota bacterium]|nr:response regulator [Acidobacteriota bacterium]
MSLSQERTFRILVVDDEEIVLSLVTDALEDEGWEVVTASNADEALRQMCGGPFDLILSDIRMPGTDGIELVRRVREQAPDIAVLFMTGYANLSSAKEAIKQGAIDYIMKPFELMEIRQAVHSAVQKKLEAEERSPDHQLKGLSDLNYMLFHAGDRKSLIVSSLKFALMHQHADHGSILFVDPDQDRFIMVSINDDSTQERSLAKEPLASCLDSAESDLLREPVIISSFEEHPVFKHNPDPNLKPYLCPDWMHENLHMVVVPVTRADGFYGMIMLGFEDDTVKLSGRTLQFLAITASQLAITLENLSLLEQSRQAYARLKELQDETIELEKMATRGQMSAEIGHELNNFLGVIAGSISLLDVHLKKQDHREASRHVKTAAETIEKIKTFTANLMDLHPISSRKEILYFDRVIREVIEYLTPQRRFRDVQIDIIELADEIPFQADAMQIQQLLYNVFNNAADATQEKGDGQIAVSVMTDPERESFRVTVSDNGVGIEPELLEKAFSQRFTTKPTGHGFGLVVCQRIIENHGGELSIDSAPGEGTTVTIDLPMAVRVPQPA